MAMPPAMAPASHLPRQPSQPGWGNRQCLPRRCGWYPHARSAPTMAGIKLSYRAGTRRFHCCLGPACAPALAHRQELVWSSPRRPNHHPLATNHYSRPLEDLPSADRPGRAGTFVNIRNRSKAGCGKRRTGKGTARSNGHFLWYIVLDKIQDGGIREFTKSPSDLP